MLLPIKIGSGDVKSYVVVTPHTPDFEDLRFIYPLCVSKPRQYTYNAGVLRITQAFPTLGDRLDNITLRRDFLTIVISKV